MATGAEPSSEGWNAPSLGYIQKENFSLDNPEPIISTDLPNESIEIIAQILAAVFQYRYKINISHSFEVMQRLRKEAVSLRKPLQDKGRAAVQLDDLYEKNPLYTVIYKSQVEAWLALSQEKAVYMKEPPARCPACHMPMAGSWTCLACGLELESPYRHMQMRSASQTPIHHLPYHYALLSDPERRRVLFINCREGHRVVWAIDAEQWSAETPQNALYCGGKRILVTDKKAHRVFEVGLFGELLWEFQTNKSERHALHQPLKATVYRRAQEDYFLIADTGNHRVLMVDRDHHIHWQYGLLGIAGREEGYLNTPTDIQMTPDGHILIVDSGNQRILEINPDSGRVIWESPANLRLLRPTFAERLPNRHMMIVDAGNYRILELNAHGTLEEEVVYYNQSLDPRFRMEYPIQYIRRENQNILLGNAQRIMEIDFVHKRAVWISTLNELNYAYQEDILHTLDAHEAFVFMVQQQDAPPAESLSLDQILAKTQVFQQAPPEFFQALLPYLTTHTYYPEDKIVEQGQSGDAMFIIRKGKVQVIREPDTLLATLEAGDIFGEMALVLSEPRSATVKAVSTCEVYRLSKWAFETAVQAFPEVYQRIRELAQSRANLTRLKIGKHSSSEEASAVLQKLLDAQQARLQQIKAEFKHHPQTLILFRPPWRLMYSKIEQRAIHEAIREGYHCFELHLHTRQGQPMTQVQASHALEIIQAIGDILKLHPSPEAIMKGLLDDTLALTLITRQSQEQVLEDFGNIESFAPTQLFVIDF